jgi:hypothetical protein
MKKALLGLANNISFHKEKIKLWSESFKKFSDNEIILLAANATEEDIQTCIDLNIKYKTVTVENTWFINHKRLEHILNFLKTTDIDLFIITDVFDVIFQSDPFIKLDTINYDLFTSGEGVNVNQDPWNYDNIKKIFPNEIEKCIHQEIICSGIIAGKREQLIVLYQRMFDLCEESSNDHNIKDQAALIVMITNNEIQRMKIFNLDEGWAMHCAVSGPTEFFHRWGFINTIKYGIPQMIDNNVCTLNGEQYDIVHQFNRVPEWYKIIKEKFNVI